MLSDFPVLEERESQELRQIILGRILIKCRQGLSVFCGMNRDVADWNSWSEAATLVETMDTRIFPATLHQDMMAAIRPGHSQRGSDDRPAMPLPAKLAMGDDILEERVPASGPEKVGGNNEHAGRCNGIPRFGDEDGNSLVSPSSQTICVRLG